MLPASAAVRLVHVSPRDVERLVEEGPGGLLGRRPPATHPKSAARAVVAEEAHALLKAARTRLARPAELQALWGHPERELLEACADADLLVLARDGELRLGPKSFSRQARFVLDHAPCAALVVWDGPPPPADAVKLPPHLRHGR